MSSRLASAVVLSALAGSGESVIAQELPLPASHAISLPPRPNHIKLSAQYLVQQLGFDEFSQREFAEVCLSLMGRDARDALIEGMKSPDPEIARRAKGLYRVIRAEELWDARIIEIDVRNKPIKEVIKILAEKSETPIIYKPDLVDIALGRNILTYLGRGSVWKLLEEITKEAKLDWSITGGKNGTAIEVHSLGKDSLSKYAIDGDILALSSEPITFNARERSITVPVKLVAPGYRLLTDNKLEIHSVHAVTDAGEKLIFRPTLKTPFAAPKFFNDAEGRFASFMNGDLVFRAPQKKCQFLTSLEIVFTLRCFTSHERLSFTGFSGPKTISRGGVQVTCHSVNGIPGNVRLERFIQVQVNQGAEYMLAPRFVFTRTDGNLYRVTAQMLLKAPWSSDGYLQGLCLIPPQHMMKLDVEYSREIGQRKTEVKLGKTLLPYKEIFGGQ